MKRTVFAVVLSAIAAVFLCSLLCNAQTPQTKDSQPGTAIMNKLQEVINNQQLILQKLDDIKAELEVVKIRATRR